MAKRTQTTENYDHPWFNNSYNSSEHPWFNRGSESEPKSESRIRKWGKRVLVGTVLGGALFGGGYALDKHIDSENAKEVAQMNERFEPVLKPAAEDIARFVADKVEDTKKPDWDSKEGIATVIDDPSDANYSILSYARQVEGGEYRVEAVVGEDSQGRPDVTKVKSAEIWETAPETPTTPGIDHVISINENDPIFNKGYWGASVTFNNHNGKSGADGLDSYNTYNYAQYDNLEEDVDRARGVAEDVGEELDKIDKSTPIY